MRLAFYVNICIQLTREMNLIKLTCLTLLTLTLLTFKAVYLKLTFIVNLAMLCTYGNLSINLL